MQIQVTASGNITACTFVKMSGQNTVAAAAAATDIPVGIAQRTSQQWDSAYAATSGYPVALWTDGEAAELTLGSGGATYGQLLVSDASGYGVAVAAQGTAARAYVGARALRDGSAGDTIPVQVVTMIATTA